MDDLHETIELGRGAELLLKDPLVQSTVERLKKAWADMIFSSAPGDTEGRNNPYYANLGLDSLLATLQSYVQEKELAEDLLEELLDQQEDNT